MNCRPFFACLLAGALVWTGVGTGCATRPEAVARQRFEFQKPQMGVPFRIVLYAPDEAVAQTAANAAWQRLSQLNDTFTDYEATSELSRLSKTSGTGQWVHVSDDLWSVLVRAEMFAKKSEGAFDITVGPVVQLWRKARREREFPDATKLAAARQAVGWRYVELDGKTHSAKLLVPGMKLDLGGIAKGWAVQEAQKVLRQHGITQALVSGGGDLMVSAPPPGKKAWRIELSHVDESRASEREFITLKNAALATSGDTFQFVELNGTRYSHIVDPRTGVGLTNHCLVNVIAADGGTADALTKLVSVLGPEAGLALLPKVAKAEARVLWLEGGTEKRLETSGFRRHADQPTGRSSAEK